MEPQLLTWTDGRDLQLLLFLFHTEEFARLRQSGGGAKAVRRDGLINTWTCFNSESVPTHLRPCGLTCPSVVSSLQEAAAAPVRPPTAPERWFCSTGTQTGGGGEDK